MDRPPQRFDQRQRDPPCPCPVQQASLRPHRRAGDQQDLVAAAEEVFAAKEDVFLGPAEDHPGNDVGDAHGSGSIDRG